MAARKFSLYDIEQFVREAGAERVTEDAVVSLEKELEKLAERIANEAARYAEHGGRRRLIRSADILLTDKSGSLPNYSKPGLRSTSLRKNASTTNASSRKER